MKIAILIPMFPPKWLGGTEIATYNIAKHLAKRGHQVHVITSFDEGLPKEVIEQGFYVHRIECFKIKFLRAIILWLKILFLFKKIKPDIVHAQSVGAALPALLSKKFLRRVYAVWGQGSEIYLPWRFKMPISKLVLRNANIVISLTEDMKREMQKICNREVYLIPNGIDLEKFENLSKDNTRKKLQFGKEEKIILFVGSLRSLKGVKYLIEAMAILKQKVSNIRLIIIGDGKERQDLEKQTNELNLVILITFIGKVPNEKVPEYMAASDIFVLPSLSEGLPVTILEAMASGLPIVASKVGGLPEIVKNRENGFLVEPGNSKEIAERILLLLRDDELKKRIAENNKQKVKNYSWENIISRLEKLYQKISDGSSKIERN